MCFAVLASYSVTLNAQISQGGTPPSFKAAKTIKSALNSEILQSPNLSRLQAEDRFNDSIGMPYRIASMIPVDICMDHAGNWDTLSTGEKIWRLKITSHGAAGLYLIYDNFRLAHGSKLFLYSEDKQFVIGAFTEQNNHPSGMFATEIVPGESCILEYVPSGDVTEKPSICISKVYYVYRGMGDISPAFKSSKAAGSCEVNVRCSPEGDNWKDVKRSVAKLVMGGYACSGNLLNNTAQDFKNLFSTAFHCIEGLESGAPTWIFYFNFEQSTCSPTSIQIVGKTMVGADIRAKIPTQKGGDGVLLELLGAIPSSYNPYWAGWDIADTIIAGGACIHHPEADVKKISTIRSYWRTSTWFGSNGTKGASGAHWVVTFAATPNGHGTTEPGSSGSGLFGPDERYRGVLTGGNSSCDVPGGPNLFGKLSYNWNKYDTIPDLLFKRWLDPLNTGQTKLNGIDKNVQNGIFWTSSPPVIDIDSFVYFKDESQFNPTSWNWIFTGGEPSTSNSPNPVVKYNSTGLYDVSLQITNDKGTFTKTRTDYVYVRPKPVWLSQNSRFSQPSRGINGFSIVDSLVIWAWAYDGFNSSNQILEYTRTTNGGTTWKADSIVNDSIKGFGMGNLFAISRDTAYATIFGPKGGGHIIQTKDGGKTWQVQTSATFTAPDGFPNFVYFFDRNNGICGGDPNNGYFEIYTTQDGGNNWTRVPSNNIPVIKIGEAGTTDMYDAVGDTIWFGTSLGRVYRSIDKGYHWTVTATNMSGQTDVKFRNSTIGFAIKREDPYTIKKTVNGGNSWSNYTLPSNFLQGDLAYVPGSNATWINVSASAQSGSAYSIDDGVSFFPIDDGIQYTAVKFYNKYIGWAGSFNTDSLNGGIYKWDKRNAILTSIKQKHTSGSDNLLIFSVYPNPTQGLLYISANHLAAEKLTITLMNFQGAEILKKSYKNQNDVFSQNLDISQLAAGIYFLVIQTGANFETHKIVLLK